MKVSMSSVAQELQNGDEKNLGNVVWEESAH
jgi:hypothetical protein